MFIYHLLLHFPQVIVQMRSESCQFVIAEVLSNVSACFLQIANLNRKC